MSYKGKNWYTLGTKSSTQSSVGVYIADQKPLSKEILKLYKIPTSKYCTGKRDEMIKELESFKFPVVMKPIDDSHGNHVIIGIKTIEKAIKLLDKSKQVVMFEETLEGFEFRILCINNKFVAAAKRNPAFVTGNGENTIKELIEQKNLHPWRGADHTAPLSTIIIDQMLINNLKEQNLTLNSIPIKNQHVYLRKTSNLSAGGEAENVTNIVCKENILLFEKISKMADLNITGIDVMCQDLSKPITDQPKAGIVEINGTPGLRMHHYPSVGEPIDVTSKFLDMILKTYQLD